MTETLTYAGTLTVTQCWCGIRCAIPAELYKAAKSDSSNHIYCPLGHTFVYRESEADQVRKELELAQREARFARASRDAAWDQLAAHRRSAAAVRGWNTRLRNRIANGVCPVAGCKRHFDNVQAHIAGQHPDWAAEHPEALS